ncbi:hypothetical protein [environmental halophage 1 AAJ-2005]|nr:hypothetical protein [environmental halophage 1 AAJ-2005]
MTDEHVMTAIEPAWIEAQHRYNPTAEEIVRGERTIQDSHGLHAEGEYNCSCNESFSTWQSATEHLQRAAPEDPAPPQHVAELLTILNHVDEITNNGLVNDLIHDVRATVKSGTQPVETIDELTVAEEIAVEADYRQRVIDAVKLAVEHVNEQYTVPGGNIPTEILPGAYPDELRRQMSLTDTGGDE